MLGKYLLVAFVALGSYPTNASFWSNRVSSFVDQLAPRLLKERRVLLLLGKLTKSEGCFCINVFSFIDEGLPIGQALEEVARFSSLRAYQQHFDQLIQYVKTASDEELDRMIALLKVEVTALFPQLSLLTLDEIYDFTYGMAKLELQDDHEVHERIEDQLDEESDFWFQRMFHIASQIQRLSASGHHSVIMGLQKLVVAQKFSRIIELVEETLRNQYRRFSRKELSARLTTIEQSLQRRILAKDTAIIRANLSEDSLEQEVVDQLITTTLDQELLILEEIIGRLDSFRSLQPAIEYLIEKQIGGLAFDDFRWTVDDFANDRRYALHREIITAGKIWLATAEFDDRATRYLGRKLRRELVALDRSVGR